MGVWAGVGMSSVVGGGSFSLTSTRSCCTRLRSARMLAIRYTELSAVRSVSMGGQYEWSSMLGVGGEGGVGGVGG